MPPWREQGEVERNMNVYRLRAEEEHFRTEGIQDIGYRLRTVETKEDSQGGY